MLEEKENSRSASVDGIKIIDGQPHLEIPSVTWWKSPGLRHLYLMIPILFLGSTINGYDGSLLNGLQTMDQWQGYFDNPNGSRLGLFTAIQNIGAIAALPLSPYAADWFGRRIGVEIGIILIFVGVIVQVVPGANAGMFIGGRFLVGFGSNFSQGCAPLLIIELAHPQHRGVITTMYNTLWYVGSIIAAWTVYGTIGYSGDAACKKSLETMSGGLSEAVAVLQRTWRIPVGLQALMPFVQFVGIWLLPESPRWLCSKDRGEDAMKVLVKYHADGNANDAFVKAELVEIQETIALEQAASRQGWAVFLQTKGNRKRLLLIVLTTFFSQCSGNGIASYYLHDILESVGVTDPYKQSLVNGGLQIWSFLCAIGFAFLVDKLGRRKLFLTAAIGMLLTFSVWTGCSAVYQQTGNAAAGGVVIAMIFLFYLMAGFAWPGLTVSYCSEILPFSIRAKGLAIAFAGQASASVLNQYINPIGLESLKWRFYFVYIVILVIECLCIYYLFVETKGPTLEEIALLFDGNEADLPSEVTMKHRVQEKPDASASRVEYAAD